MAPIRTIDVQDFMNSHKLSSYQVRIIALCFLIVAIDGFDTAAIGFIAPALRAEWGVSAAQLAPLFGAGLFGLMVGAFIFDPLADKIGRKYALVLTVRTGLEDNIRISKDRLASSNAELAQVAVDLCAEYDVRPATAAEARSMLGLAA